MSSADATHRLEHWPADSTPAGAVLALHGGRVAGHRPVGRLDLPVLRMRCLARAVHARVAPAGVSTWVLRFDVQGWNGDEASPVDDARRAIEHITATEDVPVVLLGHSMGARTALRVAGEPGVCGVVALAPWLPRDEPMGDLVDRRLLVAHGTADRTTDPRLSRIYASRAWGVAASVRHVDVERDGHAMLRRPGLWNDLAADATLDMLGLGAAPGRREASR
ncbi:MAG: alpha/beta fold hydrolase [Acidimicrobiales bacterium]